eukprot:gnl/MRDRNA2_/MRDRNA2_112619_c0_seq1.p1 gnl/MRDRNA2_/MRDRNA2_112619_c0~~gnl/MRDRNA2_/MRDRNA2_112619_c0_seq1.p1  ORF type:complete len:265 (+),score=36.09 gnl/MRDRNA2_/MRDRNA2_112619_c0_seq1:114-908(+)
MGNVCCGKSGRRENPSIHDKIHQVNHDEGSGKAGLPKRYWMVNVTKLNGDVIDLAADPDRTIILQIKSKIASIEDIPVHQQKLFAENQVLRDGQRVRECGNADGLAMALVKLPDRYLRNDEGRIVRLGYDTVYPFKGLDMFYCGVRESIEGEDGRCGPSVGPQCKSCRQLQTQINYHLRNDEGLTVRLGKQGMGHDSHGRMGHQHGEIFFCNRNCDHSVSVCGTINNQPCSSCVRFNASHGHLLSEEAHQLKQQRLNKSLRQSR